MQVGQSRRLWGVVNAQADALMDAIPVITPAFSAGARGSYAGDQHRPPHHQSHLIGENHEFKATLQRKTCR